MRDEYVVWAVIIVVVVLALAYSWGNSREHMESQKCWGSETPMSAETKYPNETSMNSDYKKFETFVNRKMNETCSQTPNDTQCWIRNLMESLDTAKSYCSSKSCTAILSTPFGDKTHYVPYTGALTSTVLQFQSGHSVLPKIILPIACVSSSAPSTGTTQPPPPVDSQNSGSASQQPTCPAGFTFHGGSGSCHNSTTRVNVPPICPAGTMFDPPTGKCTGAPQLSSSPVDLSPIQTPAPIDPGDSYILKSSLVPCTCTTHTMGCEKHAGGTAYSVAPGDHDSTAPTAQGNSDQGTAQRQSGLMRPFSSAFSNQGEPTGFLNSFSAFG